jgi:hypothetical protein
MPAGFASAMAKVYWLIGDFMKGTFTFTGYMKGTFTFIVW